MRYNTDQIYFKSPEEMKKLFADTPEAIDNTLAIAEMCHLEFEPHKFYLPDFPIPDNFKSKDDYLAHMARNGFATRYPRSTPELETRLNYELSVIASMGFAGYFLVVADLVEYAKTHGVAVGPGRGSAAGSLVSYCLGITDIDPIKFDLLFERFLNPERISMPDIDIDFSDRGRDQVIQYVIKKYGKDNVCQIITFGTMAARAVVRDVGRVLGMSYAEVDRIAKIIPFELDMTLEKALRLKPELKQMAEDDPRVSTLLDYSQTLEGLTRHASTHAAGVVIAPAPLTDFVPLFKGSKGEVTTQYSMKWIESIGLLKMDFLGLRTLTVLEDAEKAVRENRGVTVNWDELGLEDAKVFDLFASGETTGIFQFESSGMRDYLRKLRPSVFEDIIAMNALYRPGALDANMIEKYIDRKYGREKVEYYHPAHREDPPGHLRRDRLSGSGHAGGGGIGRVLHGQSRHVAVGDGQKERRPHGQDEVRVHRGRGGAQGTARCGRDCLWFLRDLRPIWVQPGALGGVRRAGLSLRVAQVVLPGRVHGGPDDFGNG